VAELAPSEEALDEEPRMGFLEHLDELRSCLRNAAVGLVLGTAVAYVYRKLIFAVLALPMLDAWESAGLKDAHMVFTGPAEYFMVLLKLSLMAGVFLASPIVFRELWKFISPGLYDRERRFGLLFIVCAVSLFVGGAIFAYSYVLPASYKYFLSYAGEGAGTLKDVPFLSPDAPQRLSVSFAIRPMISVDEYFGFTSMLLLVFGLVFELPLILAVLAALGVVSAGTLWRFNRYAVLIFAIAGAVLTPGDLVVGQLAMTVSLTVLYNISILIALVVGKRRAREEALVEAEEAR
jgi:sec-independent protein translocase protein TatC